MADASEAGRPDPAAARTPAEFVEAMRCLKRWTGLGFRQLEKRAVAGGHSLPRSTLTVALTRHTLPREDLVTAFAHACGCDEDEAAQWVAARRRIAAGGVVAPATDGGGVADVVPPQTGGQVAEPGVTPPLQAASVVPPPRLGGVADVVAPPEVGSRVAAGVVPPSRAGGRRRFKVRTAIVLLVLAMVATVAVYLLRPKSGEPQHNPDQAAPAGPGTSQTEPTSQPESSVVIAPVTAAETAPQSIPAGSPLPAARTTTTTAPAPPPQQVRLPVPTASPKPPTSTPPTQAPEDPGRDTIQRPGEPSIHCPTPYLGTHYGPLAQCTQQSGDQVRPGFYSPYTQEFGPTMDWMTAVDKKWFDGSVLATDGVHAWARGYGTVNTHYGAGVWATQYRDGEARWGVVNLVTNRFYPASTGWQPAGR